ncbi:MAG TPA: hypothetical protein DC057_20080 [Spirochaetia bacterium]|nr:hypothetical protein [Spirochaetia bacterium]
MKIKIDSEGYLQVSIKEINEGFLIFKQKFCPFRTWQSENRSDNPKSCGDWCALFGEPVKLEEIKATSSDLSSDAQYPITTAKFPVPARIVLSLCHKTLYCDKSDFTDERK